MRKFRVIRVVLGATVVALFGVLPALAQGPDSHVIYTRKSWEVRVVRFSDATRACVARVQKRDSSFSIWAGRAARLQLQFYAKSWTLPDRRADMSIQVDYRRQWTLSNAHLNRDTVVFSLPDGAASDRFLYELSQGRRIVLMDRSGADVGNWSLAGSFAAIARLRDCADNLPRKTHHNYVQ